jgi:serine/threonine-protein kinase PRP4
MDVLVHLCWYKLCISKINQHQEPLAELSLERKILNPPGQVGLNHILICNLSNVILTASPALSTPATPVESQDSPPEFAITNDQDLANKNGDLAAAAEEDGPSAADYDPTVDMREDRRRDDQRHHDDVPSAYEETQPALDQDVLLPEPAAPIKAKVKKPKDDFDMFAEEDDDDMFAEESPVQTRAEDNAATDQESSIAVLIPQGKELDISMLDNWDDPEGYYKIILGELLNGRYHVQTKLGRGMFSDVVRATDVTIKKLVAIKLIRNNDTM